MNARRPTARTWLLSAALLALVVVALVQTVSALGRRPQTFDREAERAAIQKVLDDQDAAWNRKDLEGFMAGYWKSPELRFYSGGDVQRGWDETIARYRKRYQAEGKEMGTLTFSDLEIEVLGPDVAFARGRWQLVMEKEKPGGLFTLLLKKLPEGWRIVHDHTSAPEKP